MKFKVPFFISLVLIISNVTVGAQESANLPTPPDIWKNFDPDAGDFEEEIVTENTVDGIYHRDSYISVYVNGEKIRVFCKYSVKADAKDAPGLMDVHGWMGSPRISKDYVEDGWAVMAHDYCGIVKGRAHYTKYPPNLIHGNMDRAEGPPVWEHKGKNRASIEHYNETSDYMWYVIQRRVLSYLLSQKEVDPNRIGAKGYSYGGTIMWNLGMDSRVKAIVAYFGIGWNNYYRTKRVWKYNVPYVEPEKTSGESLYLSSMAPQAHAPHITAATLWLNGSNDHHGGHERSEESFAMYQKNTPWDFAVQARGHHNTEKLGNDCKLWLEKHVLDKDHFWPTRPTSKTILDSQGVPEHQVTPATPDRVTELQIHYCLKSANNIERAWRDAETIRDGDRWTAKLPVLNVDDYLFAYATIRYDNDCVVSSNFVATIPSDLGNAVATDKPSNNLSEEANAWKDSAAVEGIGGVTGFRIHRNRGSSNNQFSDPKWTAPKGAQLAFKFYCTQPQTVVLSVNDHFNTNIEITASDDQWQTVELPASSLKSKHNAAQSMQDWSTTKKVSLSPGPGSDITKVIFADFKWIIPPAKQLIADESGKTYLDIELANQVESFWRVMQDKSVSGSAISIGGKQFEKGLGLHADSKVSFPINGKFTTFHATPGPDDAHGGMIEMKVLVDGKEAFNSGKIRKAGFVAKPIVIPVKDAQKLTLIVTDGGDGKGGDHANWANAYLSSE